ncbi:MAG: histidinol-phosphate transaminase [Armatimonadetes bacterium]|nr:histidinol-phosphate transaminase [Armatimonadota bacterium]
MVRPCISRLTPYQPGKPIEEVKRELGLTDVIKMASNENVLGPSPKAIEAMRNLAPEVFYYPEGSGPDLRSALAKKWDVSPDQIILGNGSDEIISYLGLTYLNPGDEILQAEPTFSEYRAIATLCDAETISVPSTDDLRHNLTAMRARATNRTKLFFIGNPNNPTGTIVTRDEVEALLADLPDQVIVVLDEAYYEYVESAAYPDSLDYVRQGKRVIVLRTFSKAYALAGLRVGYGIAPPEIIGCLNQVRQPFNVNSIAQAAATASLTDETQVARSRKMNSEGKQYLYGEFDRLSLKYAPSEANFIFVDTGKDSKQVFQALLKRGVIVRTGDVFGCPTFIRVTMGTRDMNERFVRQLETVLAEL